MASEAGEFWHTNLSQVPEITGAFIEAFAKKNLPIKATLTRGYKFFTEGYIHDTQGLYKHALIG